jgi:hypothetical protein
MNKKILAIGILMALISGTFLSMVPANTNALPSLPWDPPTIGDDFFNYTVDGSGKVVSLKYWNVVNSEYRTWDYSENTTALYRDWQEWIDQVEWDGFFGGYWVDTTWVALAFSHLDPNQTGTSAIITANALKVSQSMDLLDNYIGRIGTYNASLNLVTISYAQGILDFSREVSKVSIKDITVANRALMYRDLFNSYRSLMTDLTSCFAWTWDWWQGPFNGFGFGSQAGTKAGAVNVPTQLENITNAIDKNINTVKGSVVGRNVVIYQDSADDVGVGLALTTNFLTYRQFFFHKSLWVGYYLRGKETMIITGPDGEGISNVAVTLTHLEQEYTVGGVTNGEGVFEFEVPRGEYAVTMERGGYEDLEADTTVRFLQNEETAHTMEPVDTEDKYQPYTWFIWGGIAVIVVLTLAMLYRNRTWVNAKLKKAGKWG